MQHNTDLAGTICIDSCNSCLISSCSDGRRHHRDGLENVLSRVSRNRQSILTGYDVGCYNVVEMLATAEPPGDLKRDRKNRTARIVSLGANPIVPLSNEIDH